MCPCSCLRSWCPSCFQKGGGAGHASAVAGASCLTGGRPLARNGQACLLLHCACVPHLCAVLCLACCPAWSLKATQSLCRALPGQPCMLAGDLGVGSHKPLLCRCDPFTYEPYEPYEPKPEQQAASASVGARHCPVTSPHGLCTSCPGAAPCFAALLHAGSPAWLILPEFAISRCRLHQSPLHSSLPHHELGRLLHAGSGGGAMAALL